MRQDISKVLDRVVALDKKAASDYQKFVKKELGKASDEEKKDMSKLMKDIAKRWNSNKTANTAVASDYQEFLKKEIGDKLKNKEDFEKLPEIMQEVDKKWDAKDEKASVESEVKLAKEIDDRLAQIVDKIKQGQEITIHEAIKARVNGMFKRATKDLYQNVETQDFWKIESGNIVRLIGEDEIVQN